jgi:NADPH2:quinone reductase
LEAFYLTRYGNADQAFEKRPLKLAAPAASQVRIAVEAFGLNFADVMARRGYYREAPPLPAILGYEVVGRVESAGENAGDFKAGQRVIGFTRFGGYATHALCDHRAVATIPETMDNCTAASMATQGCTAYFAAFETVPVRAGDHVLVQAAAGGVGSMLVQLLKQKGAIVYGTAGSDEKFPLLKKLGVDFAINYRSEDPVAAIRRLRNGKGLDVIFDNIGGKTFRNLATLLEPGGRIVGYGGAERLERNRFFGTLGLVLGFGFMNPVKLLVPSKTMAGINMLRIADHKPELLRHCMHEVIALCVSGALAPVRGGIFPAGDLPKAHAFLESRKSTGKLVLEW